MEQEYSTSIFCKILYGIFAICLFSVTIYLSIANYKGNNSILILPLIGTISSVLIAINLYKRKLVLTDDSISYTNIWGSKKLLINNIRGYRGTKNAYYIYPIDNSYPKISLYDNLSIGDSGALMEWLFKHLKDVDQVAFENDKQAIFNNTAIGKDPEQREDKYENAVIYAIAYNIAGAVLFILSFMLNIQHWILTCVLLVYPFIGIFFIFFTKGIVRFAAKLNGSAYRSLYCGIGICEACLLSKGLSKAIIIDDSKLWWLVIFPTVVFLVPAFIAIIKWTKSVLLSQLFFIVVFAIGYGFGSILVINRCFDVSKEQAIPIVVVDHQIIQGRSTNYMLTLSGWNNNDKTSISVSSSFYDSTKIGDTLKTSLKQGALHIPWFTVYYY